MINAIIIVCNVGELSSLGQASRILSKTIPFLKDKGFEYFFYPHLFLDDKIEKFVKNCMQSEEVLNECILNNGPTLVMAVEYCIYTKPLITQFIQSIQCDANPIQCISRLYNPNYKKVALLSMNGSAIDLKMPENSLSIYVTLENYTKTWCSNDSILQLKVEPLHTHLNDTAPDISGQAQELKEWVDKRLHHDDLCTIVS